MNEEHAIPRVTLGLPVYNGENYLALAIASILAQDFTDFELIIVDNASTDNTARICADFAAKDARIRYVRNEHNIGAGGNFNRAFHLNRSPYFKWCAHDDLHTPDFLTQTVRVLDEHPDCVIAFSHLVEIDENGRPTGNVGYQVPDMQALDSVQRFALLVKSPGLDGAMFGLWRREAAALSSLHAPYYSSDRALLAEMALLGTFVQAPTATLYNRDHPRRSVRLHHSERIAWQDAKKQSQRSFEITPRIAHYLKIAWRHRDRAPLRRTLPLLARWILSPRQSGRVILEGIGFVSPKARNLLRHLAVKGFRFQNAANPHSSG